jgi:hypothetical protein
MDNTHWAKKEDRKRERKKVGGAKGGFKEEKLPLAIYACIIIRVVLGGGGFVKG